MKRCTSLVAAMVSGVVSCGVMAHPLDGLNAEEYQRVTSVLKAEGVANDTTLYPEITLLEPPKADVLAWKEGDELDRRATVHMSDGEGGFNEQ